MSKLPHQERALAAILSTHNLRDAAKECGLSERTLRRYRRDPDFLAALRAEGRDHYEVLTSRVLIGAERAVFVLRRNLDKGSPASQNNAAKILLDQATKAIELRDILERLEALELNADTKPA